MVEVHDFQYRGNEFYCEEVPVKKIAEQVGTPVYIYSHKILIEHFRKLDQALAFVPHLICYSVKSNSNLAVCRALANAGAGFDIVSGGELLRALKAGADPKKVVFAGVGKTEEEIKLALQKRILFFTVESEAELRLIAKVAEGLGKKAPIAVRINPDVDPQTHKYISTGKSESKFGLDIERAKNLYREAKKMASVNPVGIQMHIGSQITTPQPYVEALQKMTVWIEELRKEGIKFKYFDIGGGLGIIYSKEQPSTPDQFASAVRPFLEKLGLTIIMEPGRFIAGNAGILVTKVIYVKDNPVKKFVIVDAGMNDLIRPSLYGAYHEIVPAVKNSAAEMKADIVGPVCESGDFFAKERQIPEIHENQYLVLMGAGAYGFTMASNYNTRPRAAEVMVNGADFAVIRERETFKQLIAGEKIPAWLEK